MAKIKFGMMMTDARGKLGGQVFSKNRSGSYVRTKVTPVNPRTAFQQANRSLLGSISSAWSSLTVMQRNAWNSSVESWQKTNVFGDLTKPTGKNLFTGLNKVAVSNFPGTEIMVLPPAKVEFPSVVVTNILVTSGVFPKSLTLSGVKVGDSFQVRATGSLSAGTSYFKNSFRSLGAALLVEDAGILDFATAYNAVFGLATLGSAVAVEIRQVSENGQLGVPIVVSAIVTTG